MQNLVHTSGQMRGVKKNNAVMITAVCWKPTGSLLLLGLRMEEGPCAESAGTKGVGAAGFLCTGGRAGRGQIIFCVSVT